MGLFDRLKRAFGGAGGVQDKGIYFYVRCGRCGDPVRVRINPDAELRQDFAAGGDATDGYSVRKMVVDQRCFRPIEVRMRFDAGRREQSREIEGGEFITREEFVAHRHPDGADRPEDG